MVPLRMLATGETGEVVDVLGNERLVARLAESGLRPGCWLEALHPGDPFLLRIDSTTLSLRTDGQVEILVRLHQPCPPNRNEEAGPNEPTIVQQNKNC